MAQNIRFKHLEVDLIVEQRGVIVFVEVKARRGDTFGSPEEAITKAKVRRLAIALAAYAARHPVATARIDAIAIAFPPGDGKPILRHYVAIGNVDLAFLP